MAPAVLLLPGTATRLAPHASPRKTRHRFFIAAAAVDAQAARAPPRPLLPGYDRTPLLGYLPEFRSDPAGVLSALAVEARAGKGVAVGRCRFTSG